MMATVDELRDFAKRSICGPIAPIPTYYERNVVVAAVTHVLHEAMPQEGTTPVALAIGRSQMSLVADLLASLFNLNREEKDRFFAGIGLEHS